MIQVGILKSNKQIKYGCDNCNRVMKQIIYYEFYDKYKKQPYIKFGLCEDCSNALSSLSHYTMENGESFKYDLDEITKL